MNGPFQWSGATCTGPGSKPNAPVLARVQQLHAAVAGLPACARATSVMPGRREIGSGWPPNACVCGTCKHRSSLVDAAQHPEVQVSCRRLPRSAEQHKSIFRRPRRSATGPRQSGLVCRSPGRAPAGRRATRRVSASTVAGRNKVRRCGWPVVNSPASAAVPCSATPAAPPR